MCILYTLQRFFSKTNGTLSCQTQGGKLENKKRKTHSNFMIIVIVWTAAAATAAQLFSPTLSLVGLNKIYFVYN